MADVFVSYAREDREKVVPFVSLLEAQGWTVWWDREINPGVSFSKVIEREIALVKCVIVLWSRHSVSSDWVNAEANEGLERGILIPVILEPVTVPLIFRQTQAADLTEWPARTEDQALQRLLTAIADVIEKPVVEIVSIKQPAMSWKLHVGLALAAFVVIAFVLTLVLSHNLPFDPPEPTQDAARTMQEPVASISVLPFDGMENDIAIEISELLSRTKAIQVIIPDPSNKNSQQATFNLQAVQTGNRLLVSLFDNVRQETRANLEINLDDTSLDAALHAIVNRIAQEFNQPLVVRREVVPNDVYLRYLRARTILRQPLTESTLTQSIDVLADVVKEAPRFGEAQASMCLAYISSYRITGEPQDFEKAEKHCFRAVRLAETNPLVNIALGGLYKTAGQLTEATRSYEQALATSPFLTEAINGLAAVKSAQEDMQGAVALLRKAQHYEPNNWLHYYDLGALYFRRGLFELAVEQFLIARGLVTDQSELLNSLGAALFMLEDFENAITNWEASLGIESSFGALSNLGSAYYFQGAFERALTTYEKAIELNKRDYRGWMNAGEAAFHIDKGADRYYRRAISLAEAQLAINPDENEILSALALCYASLDEEDAARVHISSALLSGGNNIYVLYDVAVAHARLGDKGIMNETIRKMISNGYSSTLVERDANFSDRL